jgi:PAS domain S-box-containing protein
MSHLTHFGLSPQIFEKVFPFHFIFDHSFKILQGGRSLTKILGEDPKDKTVEDIFKLIQPKIPLIPDSLIDNLDREFFFKSVNKDLQLRGELGYDPTTQIFIFLGGPWVANMSQVEELGLNLKDFAVHDPSLHYFNVIQQHQNALVEARELADKLALQGKELKKKEEQLSMALEGGQDGIWDWRLDNDDFYYSPRLVEMLGYQYGEIRPNYNAIEKLIRDEDLIRLEGKLTNHFRYGEPFEVEGRWRTKNGNWKWILSRGKVVEWKSDGSPLRMVGLNSDIDERKKSEEELKSLHNRLIDAIEILDSGFVIYDKNERLVVCNSKYRSMYSEAAEVMIPGTPYDFILDALCKKGVPQKSGSDPAKWVAHRIAFHRSPGIFREEKLKICGLG